MDPDRAQTIDLISFLFCMQFFIGQLALVATLYPTFKRLQYARLTMSIWFNVLAGQLFSVSATAERRFDITGCHGVALGFGLVFTRFAQSLCGIDLLALTADQLRLELRVFEWPTALFLALSIIVLQCAREYTIYHEWDTPANPSNKTWMTICFLSTMSLYGFAAALHQPWFSVCPVIAFIYFSVFAAKRWRANQCCRRGGFAVAAEPAQIILLGDREDHGPIAAAKRESLSPVGASSSSVDGESSLSSLSPAGNAAAAAVEEIALISDSSSRSDAEPSASLAAPLTLE